MKQLRIFASLFLLGGTLLTVCANEPNKTESDYSTISDSSSAKNESENLTKPIYLTKSEFISKVSNYEKNPNEWKYLGDKPAIIDFYADWCGPCKKIAPILDELATEYKNQIYIYKINIDKEPELAQLFGVRSIPSLLFVPMRELPRMAQGALPKAELKKGIEELLLKK